MGSEIYDVIVVGQGPAGSTAAWRMAGAGLRVLGIDKERFPRYKSCGGCVSTKIEGLLDFDISPVVEDTVKGATFTYKSGRSIDILSDRPVGHNVMRDRFDHFLVEKAREAGAEVVEGVRVRGIEQDPDTVRVTCDDGSSYEGRFLIGADGAAGFTGREYFGLDGRECAVSITAEVPYDRERLDVKGKLFIDFGSIPCGYGWIFPKEDYLSVGMAGDACKVGGDIKRYFERFIGNHSALTDFTIEERTGWTVPIFYDRATTAVKGRVMLAGDTGHLVDPFLGEGIYYAILTALRAADAVVDAAKNGDEARGLQAYQDWVSTEVVSEFEVADKLAELVYNYPRLWYGIIEMDPGIMLRYYDVIRGEESHESFYDWVHDKVKTRPWKVLRKWVSSRFLST